MVRHTGTCNTHHTHSAFPPTHPWSGLQIQAPSDLSYLLQGIRAGTAIAVTDGSFKDSLGTAAFTLQPADLDTDSDAQAYVMVNQTPGAPQDMDAYRAELGGIFGIVDLANQLCQENLITTGYITVGCDCASALTNITRSGHLTLQRPHHDMLSGIRYLLSISPVTWTFHHVRGHQDDHASYSQLDRWARLNVDMDALAKLYWTTLTAQDTSPIPFSLRPFPGQWSIWHNDYRLPCWTTKRAQTLYYSTPSEVFWTRRLHVEHVFRDLDWSSAALALRRSVIQHRLWIPKWLCSTLPIGKNLVRWRQPEHMLACPRCGEDEHHTHHVIQCLHVTASAIRISHLEAFSQHLDTAITEPDIKAGLTSLMQSVCSSSPWVPPSTTSVLVQRAFQDQLTVGTDHVLDGLLSPTWARAQQEYLISLGRRTTGTQWMSRIIRRIWQIAWELWVHRRQVLESTNAATLPSTHISLNTEINLAFQTFLSISNPSPSLTRWFARGPTPLYKESIDWKTRWLEMVHSALNDP